MLNTTIISDAHPREDPRTAFWAESFAGLGYRTEIEILSGISFRRHLVSEDSRYEETPLAEHFLSPSTVLSCLTAFHDSDSRPIVRLVNSLKDQKLSNASIGHRQLVQRCLSMSALGLLLSQSERQLWIGLDIQGAMGALVAQAFGISPCVTVYDAQEVVTAGIINLTDEEIKFWLAFEAQVVELISHNVTVSPGIARWYREQFGVLPSVIPNFEPISAEGTRTRTVDGKTKFVYFGGCDQSKGLDRVIDSWPTDSEFAELHVIAKKSRDRDRIEEIAQSRGLTNSTVFFSSHDDSRDIVQFLTRFDVGIVPYQMTYPYSEASPNKFGQYLAAGLAIVSAKSGFVSDLVEQNNLGLVVASFTRSNTNKIVEEFSDRDLLQTTQKSVRNKFVQEFNWDVYFDRWILENENKISLFTSRDSGHTDVKIDHYQYKISRRNPRNFWNDFSQSSLSTIVELLSKNKLAQTLKAKLEKSRIGKSFVLLCFKRLT